MNNKNTVPMKPALLRIEQLRPFEGHPYKVQDNEEMDPVHIFPINRDKENAVISRLFSMFSINLVQAKSSKNKGF